MSRLLNVPQIALAAVIAPLIIKLRVELQGRVAKELAEIQQQFAVDCPDPKTLKGLRNKLSNIKNFLNKVEKRGNSIKKAIQPLIVAERTVLGAVIVLLALPVPNFGTTVGITSKAADLLANLQKLAKDIHDEIFLITGLIEGSLGILTVVSQLKQKVDVLDSLIAGCAETGALIAEEEGIANETTAEDIPYTSLDQRGSSKVYKIRVILLDDTAVAPLRQAVAYDNLDIIRFRSEASYSSSTQVLIDEVKFRIDNNIIV